MIRNRFNILLLCITILLTACVEEYWPDLTDYENLLVIEGIMTNQNDTVEVNISRTSSLNYITNNPVQNANVRIVDDNGTEGILYEREPGKYKLLDTSFQRVIGSSYKLIVTLSDGKIYESSYGELLQPNPIDSIYADLKYLPSNFPSIQTQGLEFYIDNHSVSNDTANYLWRMWQTYKYKATFTLNYLWEGEYIEVNDPDSLQTCYRTIKVDDIVTYSTKYLSDSKLIGYPILFTSTETKILSIRCSLLVEQLVISSKDYDFWEAVREQEQNQGDLYSHQPFQVRGNIKNISDDNEVVLGNFTVAGSTKKRIFVNRPAKLKYYYTICAPDFESIQFIYDFGPLTWPVYVTEIPGQGLALGANDGCFDCQLEGGSLIPPSFWTDN